MKRRVVTHTFRSNEVNIVCVEVGQPTAGEQYTVRADRGDGRTHLNREYP